MSQIMNFLQTEVTKFRDIDAILKKLERDGVVQNIFDTFKDVFDNEVNFTVEELNKIESQKQEKLNIQDQCQSNLSLFKSNFQLIVQMIFEKAFKSANAESKTKSLQNTMMESTRVETTMDAISPDIQKKKTKKKASKARRAASPSGNNTLNLSLDAKLTSPKSRPKKLNGSQLMQSQSPIDKILCSTVSTNGVSSFLKDKSFLQGAQQSQNSTPASKRQSRSTFYQEQNSLNKSQSFVPSEFNHIRGSVAFSRSPRGRDDRTCSPGPAAYENEPTSLRRSPSPSMNLAPKVCWFDEQAAKNESPGPGGLYPSHHFLSK